MSRYRAIRNVVSTPLGSDVRVTWSGILHEAKPAQWRETSEPMIEATFQWNGRPVFFELRSLMGDFLIWLGLAKKTVRKRRHLVIDVLADPLADYHDSNSFYITPQNATEIQSIEYRRCEDLPPIAQPTIGQEGLVLRPDTRVVYDVVVLYRDGKIDTLLSEMSRNECHLLTTRLLLALEQVKKGGGSHGGAKKSAPPLID